MSGDRFLDLRRRVDALTAAQREALASALARDGHLHARPERLVGFVVPSGNGAPSDEELRAFLGARVPEYMIPARFVALAQLPRTAAGKLDRRALGETRGLDVPSAVAERVATSPRSDVEAKLVAIWKDVLKVDDVGVDDDFFELGGDSLLSIRVIGRAGREGIRISPERFFERPTIAHMAASLTTNGTHAKANRMHPEADAVGNAPLTPIQHWFLDAIAHHRDWWNQSYLLECGHALTEAQLHSVIGTLVRHHDALRLRLVQRGGEWRQEIAAPDDRAPLRSVSLRGAPREQYSARVAEEGNREHASLRIDEGRLFRCVYFDDGDDWRRVLLIGHHLVLDGVSWNVILEDFATLVMQTADGQPLRLPAKTASARAWASALAAQAALPATIAAAAHWAAPSDADATVPPDATQPPSNTNGDAATISLTLGADVSRALVQDVPRQLEASAQAVLLAGVLLAWRRWTGHDALRLDVEGHGRNVLGDSMDVSRTVGWFTTVFPVELKVSSDAAGDEPSTVRVIGDAQAALDALPLAGAVHGLVRYLAPNGPVRAALSAHRRPEVLFNYLGAHDVSLPEASRLRVTDEPHGRPRNPHAPRAYLLEINTRLENGTLIADIEYSARVHTVATMERFAEYLRESLAELASAGAIESMPYGLAQLDATALATVADLLSELDDA